MAQPTPDLYQKDVGRRWEATFKVRWDATDDQNLTGATVVDLSGLSSAYYADGTRLAVDTIEWAGGVSGSADIYFSSMPSTTQNNILTIPNTDSTGEVDFRSRSIDGARVDPNRDAPGDIVIDTSGSADGDELWLHLTGKVKGTSKP